MGPGHDANTIDDGTALMPTCSRSSRGLRTSWLAVPALAAMLAAAPVLAQVRTATLAPVSLTLPADLSFNPASIRLVAGASPTVVALGGTAALPITAVAVARGGVRDTMVTATLVQPWPASRKIAFQARRGATLAADYQLRALGSVRGRPVSVDVPRALLGIAVAGTAVTGPAQGGRPPLSGTATAPQGSTPGAGTSTPPQTTPVIRAVRPSCDRYEIAGAGFGSNPSLVTVREYCSTTPNSATVAVPATAVTLVSDTVIRVNRLPASSANSSRFDLTVRVGTLSAGMTGTWFYFAPVISALTFDPNGWTVRGSHLDAGRYLVDGVPDPVASSAASPDSIRVLRHLPPGPHVHRVELLNPAPNPGGCATFNSFTATHPEPEPGAIGGFGIRLPPPGTTSPGKMAAITFSGGNRLGPWRELLSLRLVEANRPLPVLPNGLTVGPADILQAAVQIPADLPFGPHTVEATVGYQSARGGMYVVPNPAPALVVAPSRRVKAGDHVALATTGRFDYARVAITVKDPTNGRGTSSEATLRPDANGVLDYQVASFNTVKPLAGPSTIDVVFYLDAPPPAGLGAPPYQAVGGTPADYVNVPILASAGTPGKPVIPGYEDVVFPSVPFEIIGSQLMVPGVAGTVGVLNAQPFEILPGSTPTKLIVRVPPSSSSTGGSLTVNNGFLSSLGPSSAWGSNVYVNVRRPDIQSIEPDIISRAGTRPTVKINGMFLGFLADSASLNGVEGTIESRATTSITVSFPSSIVTGSILLKTRAGEATPITQSSNYLKVIP